MKLYNYTKEARIRSPMVEVVNVNHKEVCSNPAGFTK